MGERSYSDSVLRLHGRILAVPIAMACGMALGLFTHMEPFRSNLVLYVIGLFVVLGLTCLYFTLDAHGVTPVLHIGKDSLAIHAGGRVNLDWQDIRLISCESIPDAEDAGSDALRVVIEARRSARAGSGTRRYTLDHTYGMSARQLCETLMHYQFERQPEMSAMAAAQRAGHTAYLRTPERAEAATQQVFGRRASDRAPARR